jgi:hypothetical protein
MTETSFDLANARAYDRRTVGLDASALISEIPLDREDLMLSQSKSIRLRFVVSMCMVLAAGAVSMGTSCITSPKDKSKTGTSGSGTGTINGSIDSLGDNAAIPGATVTATDSSTGATYVATSGSNGSYTLSVPAGGGSILLSTLPANCTVPPVQGYTETNNGTLTFNITVDCPITLP